MTIRPVDLNGMIQRTQDIGTIKQQEDVKPLIDQQNIQIEVKKDEQRQATQVQQKEDTDNGETRYDAKDGSSQQYQGKKHKGKKNEPLEDGRVVIKGVPHGFDIKI